MISFTVPQSQPDISCCFLESISFDGTLKKLYISEFIFKGNSPTDIHLNVHYIYLQISI